MHWITGHLLPVCVIGVLLLHYSPAQEVELEDYDDYYRNGITEKPDYDYNVTYDYIFFSNTSGGTQDLEKYLRGGGNKHVVVDAAVCSSPSLWLLHSLLLLQLCRLIFV